MVNVFMATSFAQWTLASRWACFRFNLSATLSFRYSQLSWLTLSLSFCCHASGTRHNVISSATTQPTSPLTKSAADDGKCTLITTRPRSTTRKMRTSLPLSLSFALSLRQISCRVLWCIVIGTMILQSKVLHSTRLKTRKLGQSLLILVMSPS